MSHATEKVLVKDKLVDIDCKIVSLVKWLNSYPSVETLYSCEGDAKERGYVLFRCTNENELKTIVKSLTYHVDGNTSFVVGNLGVDCFEDALRYRLDFHVVNREMLTSIVEGQEVKLSPYIRKAIESMGSGLFEMKS